MRRLLPLAVFPVALVAGYVTACVIGPEQPWLALVWFALAVLAHDATVHVFLHECVHAIPVGRMDGGVAMLLSLLAGLPFDGYRQHHENHHRHDNGPGDWSSTWHWRADGSRRPKGRVGYVLGWLVALARARRAMLAAGVSATDAPERTRRLGAQRTVLMLFLLVLALASWRWALAYMALVYCGWAMVSLHNYGQHLPVEGAAPTTTFSWRWYNRMTGNNGLHTEHHAQPGKAWHDLRPDPAAHQVPLPHPLVPLLPSGGWRAGRIAGTSES